LEVARLCRRGDRINDCLLQCERPLLAQSGHAPALRLVSAFEGKADMA